MKINVSSTSYVYVSVTFRLSFRGLPAHTTHPLQPPDVSISGPLKAQFRSLAADVRYCHQESIVGKIQTHQWWKVAIAHICSIKLVKDAFVKCGFALSDPAAVDRKEV